MQDNQSGIHCPWDLLDRFTVQKGKVQCSIQGDSVYFYTLFAQPWQKVCRILKNKLKCFRNVTGSSILKKKCKNLYNLIIDNNIKEETKKSERNYKLKKLNIQDNKEKVELEEINIYIKEKEGNINKEKWKLKN